MTAEIGASLVTSYTAAQMNAAQCPSPYGSSSLPSATRQFLIMDINGNGSGNDPNTGNHLPYVPTQFNTPATDTITSEAYRTNLTHSIRIGDGYSEGDQTNGYGGSMLTYHMNVSTENAMLFIYYAIVAQAPTHGMQGNPTFIIRVMKKNDNQQWVQASPYYNNQNHRDTLSYYITTTPATNTQHSCPNMVPVNPGSNGWHQEGSGYYAVYYKDWTKVAINLSGLLNEDIQVQVIIYDCHCNAHYAYAYICGECRPMSLTNTGCPAGMDTNVTTLMAPTGLLDYEWYASDFGKFANVSEANFTRASSRPNLTYATWRPLSVTADDDDQNYKYTVKASDFLITKRYDGSTNTDNINLEDIHDVDSIGSEQTFRCYMKSALDPQKPFYSNLYTTVKNTKPTMSIKEQVVCGGDVIMIDSSIVGKQPESVNTDSTTWKFYTDRTMQTPPIAQAMGEQVEQHFDPTEFTDSIYVLVRSNAFVDPGQPKCYSEAIYPIHPLRQPVARMTISDTSLCDDDETVISDQSSDVTNRWLILRSNDAPDEDMDDLDTTHNPVFPITRSFNHSLEPVKLIVRNDDYTLSAGGDTLWCSDTVNKMIHVFVHPDLWVSPDTIVCQGQYSKVTVRVIDDDPSRQYQYAWYDSRTSTQAVSSDTTLRIRPTQPKQKFYIKVTSPELCEAWDSVNIYLMDPTLTMQPADGKICFGQSVTLTGGDANSYTWKSVPPDPSLEGQETSQVIRVTPDTNTIYYMWGHGSNCVADSLSKKVTVYPLPIPHVQLTPGAVDIDDPKVTLRNISEFSAGAFWTFDDGTQEEGNEVVHTFRDAIGKENVSVILSPYNELSKNCRVNYQFDIPVALYNIWAPTIFTPGSGDANGEFRIYTNNAYELFRIYIYDRRGELVFESDKLDFAWDGTHNGEPCPQGSYVYICRYRKPGMNTLAEKYGTITLIR